MTAGFFACGLHGNLSGGFRSLLLEPDEEAEGNSEDGWKDPFGLDVEQYQTMRLSLVNSLGDLGVNFVTPHAARHMLALLAQDPIPSTEKIIYRSVDLITRYPDIPSPILPSSRQISFEVAWRADKVLPQAALDDCLGSIKAGQSAFVPNIFFDTETQDDQPFLFARMELAGEVGVGSTDDLLGQLMPGLIEVSLDIESAFSANGVILRRATGEYWRKEIGVLFRQPKE